MRRMPISSQVFLAPGAHYHATRTAFLLKRITVLGGSKKIDRPSYHPESPWDASRFPGIFSTGNLLILTSNHLTLIFNFLQNIRNVKVSLVERIEKSTKARENDGWSYFRIYCTFRRSIVDHFSRLKIFGGPWFTLENLLLCIQKNGNCDVLTLRDIRKQW